jgi:hypothetical protein
MNKYRCSIKEPDCCPADLTLLYHPLALWQWNLFQQKSSILTRSIVYVTVTRTTERRRLTWRVASRVSFVSCHLSSSFSLHFVSCLIFCLVCLETNFLVQWAAVAPQSWSLGFKSRSQDWLYRQFICDVPQDGTWNRSQPLSSPSFPIRYSL